MKEKYFIDTSFIIALSSKKDNLHQKALDLAKLIKSNRISLITSEFIILELGNSFLKMSLKNKGIILINSLYDDKSIEIVKLSDKYYKLGLSLFCRMLDKNWSLTDCISIEILKEFNIKNVLTADNHFNQAGFNTLLR